VQDYSQWVQLVAEMLRCGFTSEEAGKTAGAITCGSFVQRWADPNSRSTPMDRKCPRLTLPQASHRITATCAASAYHPIVPILGREPKVGIMTRSCPIKTAPPKETRAARRNGCLSRCTCARSRSGTSGAAAGTQPIERRGRLPAPLDARLSAVRS
jgi:hypothetical protein